LWGGDGQKGKVSTVSTGGVENSVETVESENQLSKKYHRYNCFAPGEG
jgi:hypothetical protein